MLTTRIMPCSVCNGNQEVITDPECGEIICSNCGHVMMDKVQEPCQIGVLLITQTKEIAEVE
jgi:hypothetical protein